MRVAAIVPAAGSGKRLGSSVPKAFIRVRGKPLFIHTLRGLDRAYGFREFILVVRKNKMREAERLLRQFRIKNFKVVPGGATRAESVWKGLQAVSKSAGWVLVHDAARPLVSRGLVRRLLQKAKESGAVICGLPSEATLKRVDTRNRTVRNTEDRNSLYLAQTPQVFRKNLIAGRYEALGKKAYGCTDEAALFDGTSVSVKMVAGDPANIKLTVPEDLKLLEFYLASRHRV